MSLLTSCFALSFLPSDVAPPYSVIQLQNICTIILRAFSSPSHRRFLKKLPISDEWMSLPVSTQPRKTRGVHKTSRLVVLRTAILPVHWRGKMLSYSTVTALHQTCFTFSGTVRCNTAVLTFMVNGLKFFVLNVVHISQEPLNKFL
jgi:hypothetical protein